MLDAGFEITITVRLANGHTYSAAQHIDDAAMAAYLVTVPESGAALAFDSTADTLVGRIRDQLDPLLPDTHRL